MPLQVIIRSRGWTPTPPAERHITRQLAHLHRLLAGRRGEARAILTVSPAPLAHQMEVQLTLQLAVGGREFASHATAPTAEQATGRAVDMMRRQIERFLARQRGEPSYGVPSRRPVPRPRTAETAPQPSSLHAEGDPLYRAHTQPPAGPGQAT